MRQMETCAVQKVLPCISPERFVTSFPESSVIGAQGYITLLCQPQAVIIMKFFYALPYGRNLPAACHTVFPPSQMTRQRQKNPSGLSFWYQKIYRHPSIGFHLQQYFLSTEPFPDLNALQCSRAKVTIFHSGQPD